MTAKAKAELTGVSETALLTLYSRAQEARRPDRLIDDPMAILLVESIDYDFTKFGSTRQDMAIRANTFDRQTREYLARHPEATVVALAEGLQTTFWRLDAALPDARFRWLTVDFEPVIELRRRLLPESSRIELLAQSALDFSWMDRVDDTKGVFITAEGLLMYLQPEEALGLIRECAARFPGGRMMFDLPPRWFTGLANRGWLKTSRRYTVPAMPFSMTPAESARLLEIPGVRIVREIPLASGRTTLMKMAVALTRVHSVLDPLRGVTIQLDFG